MHACHQRGQSWAVNEVAYPDARTARSVFLCVLSRFTNTMPDLMFFLPPPPDLPPPPTLPTHTGCYHCARPHGCKGAQGPARLLPHQPHRSHPQQVFQRCGEGAFEEGVWRANDLPLGQTTVCAGEGTDSNHTTQYLRPQIWHKWMTCSP